jgi:pimeloyl-ACP methyl ester carboxylesterase
MARFAKQWWIPILGVLMGACTHAPSPPASSAGAGAMANTAPLACNDGLKTAFTSDPLTSVVAVIAYKAGDKVFVSDSNSPVTLAADLCMVKLLVGPGNPGPAQARSTSEGIGIEVWLPGHSQWNQRIRNYGGGGYVGGGHIYAKNDGATLETAVGSKFPAPVIAGMGYASATTDAGQRWSQNGSFTFLPDGRLNETLLKDFSYRSMVEQALKSKALVRLYYGRAQQFAYFDGHSTGGRQGWKVAQDYPEMYDGYLLAAPAISTSKFALNSFYAQVVMKADLGFTSADPGFAASGFKQKVSEVNRRAVQACDREGLGFLLDPFACSYDPLKDPAALCTGVVAAGLTGINPDSKTCVNLAEARVINKLWYGITTDGSYDPLQSYSGRSGKTAGERQLWWSFPRGSDWGSLIGRVGGAEAVAQYQQDLRFAASAAVNPGASFVHPTITERDQWRRVDYAMLQETFQKGLALQARIGDLNTDRDDLSKLRDLGRKVVTYTGLAEDAIPPATSVNHYERVAAKMGGVAELQKFVRLYLVPGKAHSSQGRAYTVASATDPSKNNTVPLPKLPGAGNQTPSREQDQLFTALLDWVEKGTTPGSVTLTSRDNSVSYPICVYPLKAVWNGTGSSKVASSYQCQ